MGERDVPRDLIVVAADLDAASAMDALLKRHESLSIRAIRSRIDRFAGRDSGCYRRAHEHLRPFIKQFSYAMVIFDRHGSGNEPASRQSLEDEVEARLAANGCGDRSAAIVLDPEFEAWVWGGSPEVDRILGWCGREPSLRTWLREQEIWPSNAPKPNTPKGAMEMALKSARKPKSPAIFRELPERVSLRHCSDPAFIKLRATLCNWFPPQ